MNRQSILKLFFLLFLIVLTSYVEARDVSVRSYTRKDGTHVRGHYRTSPDRRINNNWSTEGNINPYTGKYGHIPRRPYEDNYYNGISSDDDFDYKNYKAQKIITHERPYGTIRMR